MPTSSKYPNQSLQDALMKRYPATPAYLLAALEDVQAAMGWVPDGLARDLATAFGASPAQLESLLSMREVFRIAPTSACIVGVCMGAVCAGRGGETLLAELRQKAEGTDVCVEEVHCQGGCEAPPVAVCHGERITHATVMAAWQAVRDR
jgi:NADH:ubiquinone oxidoreductase subunit E